MLNEYIIEELNDTSDKGLKFEKFPKIPRIYKQCTVTEKVDGTNGLIAFNEFGQLLVGSRSRQIYPRFHHNGSKNSDNHGFAEWAYSNREQLFKFLGQGYHYGEWAGLGIQRGYDMMEKRFFLFNTKRFYSTEKHLPYLEDVMKKQKLSQEVLEIGLDVVPVLYNGDFYPHVIQDCMKNLKKNGSCLFDEFIPYGICNSCNPEGIIIWLNGHYYKETFDNKGGKFNEKL